MKNDETKSKTPSPSKHVLEPKRFQNIAILSKALNTTAEQICEALILGKGPILINICQYKKKKKKTGRNILIRCLR